MEKVRIVCTTGDRERITSYGKIEFDKDGVSLETIDREVAEIITNTSSTLHIEGERNKVHQKKTEEKVEEKKKDSFTKTELQEELMKQYNRVVGETAISLGLDEEYIHSKLIDPIKPEEKNILIPESVYNDLMSDRNNSLALNQSQRVEAKEVEVDESSNLEDKPSDVETETEMVEHKVSEHDIENNPELTEMGVKEGDTIEFPKKETEGDLNESRREGLLDMKIDELRKLLTELGVDKSQWEDLKGNDGKEKMVDIILEQAK